MEYTNQINQYKNLKEQPYLFLLIYWSRNHHFILLILLFFIEPNLPLCSLVHLENLKFHSTWENLTVLLCFRFGLLIVQYPSMLLLSFDFRYIGIYHWYMLHFYYNEKGMSFSTHNNYQISVDILEFLNTPEEHWGPFQAELQCKPICIDQPKHTKNFC